MVSGIGVKHHSLVEIEVAVVEDLLAAMVDGLTSRFRGSGPVVERAPFAARGTQDGPSRYPEGFGSKEFRAGVVQPVEAVDRNWDSSRPKSSRTQVELSCGCFHEADPALGFELIAPCWSRAIASLSYFEASRNHVHAMFIGFTAFRCG